MTVLEKMLYDRRVQLESRIISIRVYLRNPNAFLGKKNYSENDILKIEVEIKESEAALWGIKNYQHQPTTK